MTQLCFPNTEYLFIYNLASRIHLFVSAVVLFRLFQYSRITIVTILKKKNRKLGMNKTSKLFFQKKMLNFHFILVLSGSRVRNVKNTTIDLHAKVIVVFEDLRSKDTLFS